jgi:hypothetical protein
MGGVSSTSVTKGNSSTSGPNVVFLDGSSDNLNQLLGLTPSLGFDFEHLNAINPDLGIKALIDPITQQRLALAERLLRETPFRPLSFPFFEGQPETMLEQQPQVIVLPQPQGNEPNASTDIQAAPALSSTGESQEPLRDVGAFTLVLRDGTKISAVAFTIQDNRIVYITNDGRRRAIAVADLDKPATEQINDDRGTPIQLPQ